MGFKSRHKNRPSHMRAVSVNDKGALESRMIPSEKIPMAAFMFRFEPPGIITGRPRNPGFYARQWHLNDREKLDKLLIEEGVDNLAVSKMNPHIFARMLAKIAHSFAVAEIGLDNFTPFLQKMIIEGIETPSYYVGGDFTVPPAERDGAMHWVRLQPDDNYLVATIRLFAPLGAPLYHIIVGTLRDGGMNKFPLKE